MSDIAPDPMAAAGLIDPSEFRAQLDTTFSVGGDAGRVPLRLAEVNDGRSDRRLRRFSLIFNGPPDPVLPQGLYSFHHDAFGEIILFIVPVLGSNDQRTVYEA